MRKIIFAAVLLIGALFFGYNYFYQNQDLPQQAQAQASSDPLKGWAWSSNIGWVSFNSEDCDANGNGFLDSGICNGDDATIPVPGYKVELSSSGNLNGYAWSSNIGWIRFDPSAIGSSPEAPNQTAQIDTTTGLASGWARACNVFSSGCSGSLKDDIERGGWDGWIKMAGSWTDDLATPFYEGEVKLNLISNEFSGFAWGGDVIGWFNFYNVGVGILPTPQCNDGIDNDGDSAIDMADPSCSDINDNDETNLFGGTCLDGIDNDADCLTDGSDPDCQAGGTTENNFNAGFCLGGANCSFTNSTVPPAGSIRPGESATLSWTCSNVNTCSIKNDLNNSAVCGNCGDSGNQSVSPVKTTPYTLSCTNAGGPPISESTTVNVNFDPKRCEINPRTGVLECL